MRVHRADNDFDAIRDRHDQIDRGIKEAIRREVEHRRELGLPTHVAMDGRVIALPADEPDGK